MTYAKGTRVTFVSDMDYAPYGTIPRGETGQVTHVSITTIEVVLDTHYKSLDPWDNTVLLAEVDQHHIAPVSRVIVITDAIRRNFRCSPTAVAALLLFEVFTPGFTTWGTAAAQVMDWLASAADLLQAPF